MAPKRPAALFALPCVIRPQQCVAYGRVSSDKQREDQTIETQKLLLIGDITARDRVDLPEKEQRKLVDQFWDDGITGTIPLVQRPEGRRLLNLICPRGSINCGGIEAGCRGTAVIDSVWITKLDRLARRLQILIEIEAFFRRHGVALRSLEFNIDTSDKNGKLMFHILGVIAEWEVETIRERTHGGKRTKASEGKTVGGRPAFGLITDEDGYFVVDSTLIELADGVRMAAADIVKSIFDNVAFNGSTAWQEAERFGMTQRKVLGILHNRKYKGESGMHTGGEWLPGRQGPPRLVSPETWEIAQTKLTENRVMSSRNRHYDYLLSQVLVCCEPFSHTTVYYPDGTKMSKAPKTPGVCGRNYVARRVHTRSGRSYVYYTCTRANVRADSCSAKPLRGTLVEDAIWAMVAEAQRHPEEFINEALRQIDHTTLIRNLRMEITGIVDHLADLDSERQVILRQERKGQIKEHEADAAQAEIADKIGPLQDHKQALEAQLHSITLSATDLKRAGITSADVIQQIDRIEAQCASKNPAEVSVGRKRKAAVIHATINRIEVRRREDGAHHLTVYLRFGQALPIDILPLQRESDYEQGPVTIVREIVLPPKRNLLKV